MKINKLVPMLQVDDIKATIHFYQNILGFSCSNKDEQMGWATMNLGETEIMFSVPNEHMAYEKATFTGSFYFNTEDVNAWWELLKDKAEICYPMEDFDYGMREFAIYDCNGYILQFGTGLDEPDEDKR